MTGQRVEPDAAVTPASLWRNRDFMALAGAQTFSSFGTSIATFAVPLVVFGITRSSALAGLVSGASVLGGLVGTIVGGTWVDRSDRRRVMLTGHSARTAVMLVLGGLIALSWVTVAAFAGLTFVAGLFTALCRSGEAAALKAIVPREQFASASAVREGRAGAVAIAGGPLGAALLAVGWAVPFLASGVFFLLSLAGIASIRTPLGRPEQADEDEGYWRAVSGGFRHIWGQAAFRWILPAQALLNIGMTAFHFVLVLVLMQRGSHLWLIGAVPACIGASLLVGSLGVSRLIDRLSVGWCVILCPAAMFVCVALSGPALAHAYALLALIVAGYAFAPVSNAAAAAYLAIVTPAHLQGRVDSAEELATTLLIPLASVVGGLLLGVLGAAPTLAVLAAAVGISALVLVAAPSVRQLPLLSEAEER